MPKFISVPSTCKLCHEPITLKADPCCPPEIADRLSALVVCNRCADFRNESERHQFRIGRLCGELLALRKGKATQAEEKRLGDGITFATKGLARAYSAYYRDPMLAWDPEFANVLIENPENWPKVVAYISHTLSKIAQHKHPQPPPAERELRATAPDP